MDMKTNTDMNRDVMMTMAMTLSIYMFMCHNVNMNLDHRLSDYGLIDKIFQTIGISIIGLSDIR
jgi:hypothetical protein